MDRTGRALVWTACFAAGLAPLLPLRDLPLIDLPNHLAQAAMWLRWDDPSWGFQECYRLDLGPLPYLAYHGFLRVAGELLPIHLANKLWMALSIVGLGGGTAYLLRGLGRPPVLGLAALPLYWSASTLWGFVNFMAGLTLLVLALGLLANRRFWPGTLAGALLYFVHPLALAAWIGMAPIVAPGIWRRLVVSLPAIALFVSGMLLAPRADLAPGAGLVFDGNWPAWRDVWHDLPQQIYAFVDRGEALALAGAVILLVVVTARLVDREGPRDLRPLLLVVVAALYTFALPRNLDRPIELAGISSRFPPLLVLTLLTLPPRGTLSPGRTLALLVPLLALNVWHGTVLAGELVRARPDELAFHRIVDRLPMHPDALLVLEDRRHPALPEQNHLRLHQQALLQIERGGYDPQTWDTLFVVPRAECRSRHPALELSLAHHFRWDVHGVAYRWFVVRGDAARFFDGAPVELVAKDRAWSLWRRRD